MTLSNKQGMDWSKRDLFNALRRPDLRPKNWVDLDEVECTMMPDCVCEHCCKYPYEHPSWLEDK